MPLSVDSLPILFAESQCRSGLLQSATHLLRGCVQLNTTTEVSELHYQQCSLARCSVSNVSDTPYCCQPDQLTFIATSCSGSHVNDLLQVNEVVYSLPSAESCTCQPCSGVQFELVGRVMGVSGERLPMARVSLRAEGRTTFTNQDGLFAFRLNGSMSTAELVVSAGGYHTFSFTVELSPGLHRAHVIHITMNPEWITVLDVPDSSSVSVLVTVPPSRPVVGIHSGELWQGSGGGTVLSLPEPFRQSFLEAGFAVVVGIHSASNASLQNTVSSLLVATEEPTLEHALTGSVIGSPLNFTLSSDEEEVLSARGLFHLRMYVYSAGKLQSASKVLENVANFTLQFIHTGQNGNNLYLFHPSDSANQDYTQHTPLLSAILQRSKRSRQRKRQILLDPVRDVDAVVMSTLEEINELPEHFLVGSRVPACFVGVRAFDSEGVEQEDVLVLAMVSNSTVVTMTTGTTPVCMPVPCPKDASPLLATLSATDSTRLPYTPEWFTFLLETSSLLLFSNLTSCQNNSLRIGARDSRYIAFRAPTPNSSDTNPSQGLLSTDSALSSPSIQDPPYCYLKITVPLCDIAEICIFVVSQSSGEINTIQTGTIEGPEIGSSGMSCDNTLTFCMSYVCSSNVSVRVEKWLPNVVEPDYCEPSSISLDDYNRDNGVLVLPLATTGGNRTSHDYSIFYSVVSQRLAYAECESSPFSTLEYNCPSQ